MLRCWRKCPKYLIRRGTPRGSNSHIWSPGAFWDDAPAAGDTRLPLFLPQEVVEACGGGGGGSGGKAGLYSFANLVDP
jgi:hypothetical protein